MNPNAYPLKKAEPDEFPSYTDYLMKGLHPGDPDKSTGADFTMLEGNVSPVRNL